MRSNAWIAAAVWAAGFLSIVLTIRDYGPVWDEGSDIVWADGSVLGLVPKTPADWLLHPSFDRKFIERCWKPFDEHPPLTKITTGLVHRFFHKRMGSIMSARLSAAAFFATLLTLVYLAMASWVGRRAGLFAALSLGLMPRIFAHGHFAVTDIPITATCFATIWAFEAALRRERLAPLAGLTWGLALLTKINALFLPLAFVPYAVYERGRRSVAILGTMVGTAALVFLLCWPWVWFDTARRVLKLYSPVMDWAIHGAFVSHKCPPLYYFGKLYRSRFPISYPVVMTTITIPVGILAASFLGAATWVRRDRRAVLLLLVIGTQLALFLPPGVTKYDSERLFLPVFAFIACLAGAGFDWLCRRIARRWSKAALPATLAIVLSQGVGILTMHPLELGYYNLLVGGVPGAHKLGLETTYWGDSWNRELFGYLNSHLPDGARVAFFPRRLFDEFFFHADGYMKDSLTYCLLKDRPDYVVLFMRQGAILGFEGAAPFLRAKPIFELRKQGVVFAAVYRGR